MTPNKKFLSGNEAIAHACYRAGCKVAAAYPGTPSTEILENVALFRESIYCEWSVNEKVALEVAIGASFAGQRALCAMKHVGLNVAADPLMTMSYIGATGGLVIVSADDPGMHSSQNEQDNRFFARFAKVPMLEPADSQEAYDMTVAAFEMSETYETPVILRMTTRTSHASGIVNLDSAAPPDFAERVYSKDVERRVMVPMHARKRRLEVESRLWNLAQFSDTSDLNQIESGSADIGIITSGVVYQYVKEVFPEASVLKIGLSHPLPTSLIRSFASSVSKLLVIEELEPYMEEQIRAMGIQVEDHQTELHIGELNPFRLRQLRSEVLGEPQPEAVASGVGAELPARPPVLCAGCGHRSVFNTLRKLKVTVTGDIGCYSLGAAKPLDSMDSIVCMGASIGNSHGFEKAGYKGRLAAVLGDSTFFHSGITGLLNVIYNRGISTVIILDNRTTAMTGHQHNPGTGYTLMGTEAPDINIEQVCRGLGVKRVAVVDCYDLPEVERVLKEELAAPEPSVVIATAPCVVGFKVDTGRKYEISNEACKGCGGCLKLGCPAMEQGEAVEGKPNLHKVRVNPLACAGCSMCSQVCKFDAISELADV